MDDLPLIIGVLIPVLKGYMDLPFGWQPIPRLKVPIYSLFLPIFFFLSPWLSLFIDRFQFTGVLKTNGTKERSSNGFKFYKNG